LLPQRFSSVVSTLRATKRSRLGLLIIVARQVRLSYWARSVFRQCGEGRGVPCAHTLRLQAHSKRRGSKAARPVGPTRDVNQVAFTVQHVYPNLDQACETKLLLRLAAWRYLGAAPAAGPQMINPEKQGTPGRRGAAMLGVILSSWTTLECGVEARVGFLVS